MLNAWYIRKAYENSSTSVSLQVLILVILHKYFLDYQVTTIQISVAMGFVTEIINVCVNILMEYGKNILNIFCKNVPLSQLL